MKYSYVLLVTLFSFFSYSQIGINTNSPTSTLDIDGDIRVRQIPISASTQDVPLVY